MGIVCTLLVLPFDVVFLSSWATAERHWVQQTCYHAVWEVNSSAVEKSAIALLTTPRRRIERRTSLWCALVKKIQLHERAFSANSARSLFAHKQCWGCCFLPALAVRLLDGSLTFTAKRKKMHCPSRDNHNKNTFVSLIIARTTNTIVSRVSPVPVRASNSMKQRNLFIHFSSKRLNIASRAVA